MFEIGRELKRFFTPAGPRDGLCFGDASLLELLPVKMLENEARASDVAAGRIGAKDRPQRLIEAARAWREMSRRTGDPAALRKAAACAEQSATLARTAGRPNAVGRALCEQVQAAFLGADLFAEDGLNVAADYLLGQASSSAMARSLHARLAARRTLAGGEAEAVRAAAAGFDRVLHGLHGRGAPESYGAAKLMCERAEFLTACGMRLHDASLIDQALVDLAKVIETVDPAYLPLTAARANELRGLALVRLGELSGDVSPMLQGLDAFAAAIDLIAGDHSPLDWARLQHGQGLALAALAEAGDSEPAFDRALKAFGRAMAVLKEAPAVALRTTVAQDRASCLVNRAEMRGDGVALDEAEAILRSELGAMRAPPEPVAWAVLQLNLARVYMAQSAARGRDAGERARAGDALLAALDVFAERGLRSLAAAADQALEDLRESATKAA